MDESELLELTDELNENGTAVFDVENRPDTVIEDYTNEQETLQNERHKTPPKLTDSQSSVPRPTGDEIAAGIISDHAESFQELVESDHTVQPHDVAEYLAICTSVDVTEISEYV